MSSYRVLSSSLSYGSFKVADWSNGEFLITAKTNAGVGKNRRRVDLGFYPPSSSVDISYWDATTDGALIMANALEWASGLEVSSNPTESPSNPTEEPTITPQYTDEPTDAPQYTNIPYHHQTQQKNQQ